MNRWLCLMACACLSMPFSTPALADLINGRDYFGDWMFSSWERAGVSGCEMVDYQARKDGEGQVMLGISNVNPKTLFVMAKRPSWTIPDGTNVGLKIAFPGGTAYEASGVGDGTTMTMLMALEDVPRFLKDLVTKERMTIEFRGDEPPWNLGIDGADKAIAALRTCVKDRGYSDVPAALAGGIRTPGPTRPY